MLGHVPRLLAHDPGARVLVLEWLDPGPPTRCGRTSSWRAGSTPRWPEMLGRILAADPRRHRGRPDDRHPLRPRRAVRRPPPRPLPGGDGQGASRPDGPAARPPASDRIEPAGLVHGDVSPKNILVGPIGPVLLDAECATFGDAGLRPRVLHQPPAAQGRPPAGGDRRLPRRCGPAGGRLRHQRELGAAPTCSRPAPPPSSPHWPWPASTGPPVEYLDESARAGVRGLAGRWWSRRPASGSWPNGGGTGITRGRAEVRAGTWPPLT